MIVAAFVTLVVDVLTWVVGLFPEWAWAAEVTSFIPNIFEKIDGMVGAWVPMEVLAALVTAYVAAELAYYTVVAVVFIYNRVAALVP